ncbi:glycerol-3-phosphate dehydrogenase/oxidase [Microbacterium sediminis]|uniref:FAD-dependent oxidoreductase n=1 Tax=Microbacterium sediminis TaxID=904291 RepID=A0A1B9NFA2_9MICO|nr:glycerol-3-phosphate dehydrogenase/oxidase [Microbacterium sediminis]OCG75282.1 FAD-dependent oxidoreductase [Microbacterium sediminis]QBR74300.1 glycerol-3-phosphate dehydrogenase/oxidase [Microbacterium sediminis]
MSSRTPSSPLRAAVAEARERGRAQVLVIGGGINGIATFRDLALQGVDVLLVERGDFASGATAASSHMVHGGIRYLENGEFRLVHESVQERNRLLRNAPHFVKPLRTTIPIYSTFSGLLNAPLKFLFGFSGKPRERGALVIKVGLTIYDLFANEGRATPWHDFRGRARSLRELPKLNPRIRYTATYYDASMHDPERLALDVLGDGIAAGGRALNYVEAVGADGGAVRLRDLVSGEEFAVAADVIVNASGPWTDLTNAALGTPTRFMGGTKGSHIVLDNPELLRATGGREIFFEHEDGRIVLIYPLKGRVMVGTTDIPADPAEPARCTDEEVGYFLDLIGDVFPGVPVSRGQIVYRFSGIRPLPRSEAALTGQISRDYRVEVGDLAGVPLLSLVGGKWTTFRALGETLSSAVLDLIGAPRRVRTEERQIGGGRDYPRTRGDVAVWLRAHVGGDTPRSRLLFERYGTRAAEVWRHLGAGEDAELLGGELSTRELDWMVREEHVVHLTDVVLRRTALAFTGRADRAALEAIADALAPVVGWDAARRDREVADTIAVLRDAHGVDA